jgi:exodeoxyribonuclease VII large subunit
MRSRLASARSGLDALARHHAFRRPYARVLELQRRLDELELRLGRAARHRVLSARRDVTALAAHLESLSPLGVLSRGFSLTQRADDGRIVRDAAQLSVGESILTRFAAGRARSRVESVEEEQGLGIGDQRKGLGIGD